MQIYHFIDIKLNLFMSVDTQRYKIKLLEYYLE